MKKIDLGQTITILANLGVIAGIIFLAIELAQNQDMMMAQTRNEMTRTIIELNSLSMSDQLAGLILKGNAGEPLSEIERFQFARWATNWLRYYENATYQYSQGLFDEEEWAGQRAIMEARLNAQPGLRDTFCSDREGYSDNLVGVFDDLLHVPCASKE